MTRDNLSAVKPHAVLGRTQPWQEPAAGCCQTRWWRRRRRPLMGKDRRGKAAAGGRTLKTSGAAHPKPDVAKGDGAPPRHPGEHKGGERGAGTLLGDGMGTGQAHCYGSMIPAGPGDPQQCPAPLSTPSHPATQGPWRTHPGLTSAGDPSRQVNPIFFSFFSFFLA